MFKEVLNDVKNKEGKKVNLNILIQPSMKVAFDKLCKDNGTTMSAMMIGFIEKSLDDNPDYSKFTIQELEMEDIVLQHKNENLNNNLLNLPDFDDGEDYVLAHASLYNQIRFCGNLIDNVRRELYSSRRKEEIEIHEKMKAAKLEIKEKK